MRFYTYIADVIKLGVHFSWIMEAEGISFVITATDFAGNSTSHTIIVNRTTN